MKKILIVLFIGIGFIISFLFILKFETPKKEKKIASVNGLSITEKDMMTSMSKIPPLSQGTDFDELKMKILNNIIDSELIRQEAEKTNPGITSEKAVNNLLEKMKGQIVVTKVDVEKEKEKFGYEDARFSDGSMTETKMIESKKLLEKYHEYTKELRKVASIEIDYQLLNEMLTTTND